jgi:hypothetical protein
LHFSQRDFYMLYECPLLAGSANNLNEKRHLDGWHFDA